MAIELAHIDFAYERSGADAEEAAKQRQIFHDFSYIIEDGEIHCIMGASGYGKTTLLKLLSGRLRPQHGTIDGMERRHISMVFQENRLCEDFTAKTNIRLGCDRGYFGDFTQDDITRHLVEVGLGDISEQKVSALSGGMKRRVSIVRAILSKSDILLMDEPLKELDAATKRDVLAYIKRHRGGRTTVVVTHEMAEAEAFGGKILYLEGRQ